MTVVNICYLLQTNFAIRKKLIIFATSEAIKALNSLTTNAMKRQLFTLLMIGVVHLLAFSNLVLDIDTKTISECAEMPQVKKTVERLSNGIKVTYELDSITLIPDSIKKGAFYPILKGFGQIDTETRPWLPIFNDRFVVGENSDCNVTILEDEFVYYNIEVSPARAPQLVAEDFCYTSENLPKITSANYFYPPSIAEGNGTEVYRGEHIMYVNVAPLQYNSWIKRLCIHKKFSYLIEVSDEALEDTPTSRIMPGDPYISTLTDATNERKNITPIRYSTPAPISYLIIAHNSLEASAWEFLHTKNWMGFNVEMETRAEWTPESIKQVVKDFYEKNRYAYYVVFWGDHNLIPAEYHAPIAGGYSVYSDLYYACMDGTNDQLPDLIYGRIPISSNKEGYAYIRKNHAYHTNPNGDMSRTKFVGVADFEDAIDSRTHLSDGKEDNGRYFVRTTETVCQAVAGVFDDVERIYSTSGNVVPNSWGDGTVNFEFPDHLKTAAAWTGSTNDIVEAFNSGCNMVLHRDHGTITGWHRPSFQTSHLSRLTNTVYPVVFSHNCSSGNFTASNNFAKNIISLEEGGAAAVIGATQSTYSPYNDIMTLGVMKAIWPNRNFTFHSYPTAVDDEFDSPVLSLGEAFFVGMSKMEESMPDSKSKYRVHQRRAFHCIGDPSLYLYYGKDYGIAENLEASYDYDNFQADITLKGNTSAYISYWDTLNGKIERYYGNHLSFTTNAPETLVYIYKHGMKPIHFLLYDVMLTKSSEMSAIESVRFKSSSEMEIIISDTQTANNLSLTVMEANNLQQGNITELPVVENCVSYTPKLQNNRLYFVTLKQGNEILDTKTVYKTK